ncbi:hypothetical protein OHU34_01145 [Streptomyces sp. NBC_00080]|uniref:hypothetical protein n=1 Tax=Streptomyces sp. NBC_00080 TaxID=2975645 RepID=UPI003255745B
MSFGWHYEERRGAGVMHLAGNLGVDGTGRFTGAIGWVLARAGGPLVLEVGGLLGWSPEGEAAVLDLARRLSGRSHPLALCGVGALPIRTLTANSLIPITVHADLDSALNALEADRE